MRRFFQKGLSLVELMISLAIGSIITIGIVQLMSSNTQTYGVMMGQSRMQESARFALDFISRDIQKAGYRGCFSNNQQLYWTILDIDDMPYEFDLRFGVQGYDGVDVDLWTPDLDDLPSTIGATNTNVFVNGRGIDTDEITPFTDILTLRFIAQQDLEIRLAIDMPTSREDIQVIAPTGGVLGLGFSKWDLALIHDCEKATIFHVTNIVANAPNITIEHSQNPTDLWRNDFDTLAMKNSFESDAFLSAISTNIYFIAPGSGENSSGDTPLSLWRKSGTTFPVELVEGIENLQILYGVSTNGDKTPNEYLFANDVQLAGRWKNVTTIRVTVVANTIDDVGGVTSPTHGCDVQTCYAGEPTNGIDGLMRRSFTQTVLLRNSS